MILIINKSMVINLDCSEPIYCIIIYTYPNKCKLKEICIYDTFVYVCLIIGYITIIKFIPRKYIWIDYITTDNLMY